MVISIYFLFYDKDGWISMNLYFLEGEVEVLRNEVILFRSLGKVVELGF